MNDTQTMHAMGLDDAYHVEATLARGPYGVTELVSIDGAGPFVRKKIPLALARRSVWAALADCHSPRLPHIEASYELPDHYVVVYDYVEGRTISDMVAEHGRLPQQEAVQLIGQVCEAVRELHDHGVVHRDITPANVVVASDGAHLIDFGIAAIPSERTTCGAGALGTFGFASPEQYGFAATDPRSDIYSLARLLGYMLTGVYPDSSDYARLLTDDLIVTPQLRAAIERACAFEPSARYPDVDAFMADIDPDGDWNPAPATPQLSSQHGGGKRRKRYVAAIVAAAAAIIVIAVAVIAMAVHTFNRSTVNADGSSTSQGLGTQGGADDSDDAYGNGANGDADGSDADNDSMYGDSIQGADSGATGSADGDSSGGFSDVVELADYGWSVDASGYVNYTFAIRNTSSTLQIDYPEVAITGRDNDGAVMFSDTVTMNLIGPDSTAWYSGIAGNGVAPATVEIAANEPESYNVTQAQGRASASVSGVNHYASDGAITFAGEIGVTTTGDFSSDDGVIAATVVLRDDEGNIVHGESTFVDWPSNGASCPFSIDVFDPPDYETFEIYAQPW